MALSKVETGKIEGIFFLISQTDFHGCRNLNSQIIRIIKGINGSTAKLDAFTHKNILYWKEIENNNWMEFTKFWSEWMMNKPWEQDSRVSVHEAS